MAASVSFWCPTRYCCPSSAFPPLQRMRQLQESGGLSYTDSTFFNDAIEALLEVRSCVRARGLSMCF
jgi:hypothetical protein